MKFRYPVGRFANLYTDRRGFGVPWTLLQICAQVDEASFAICHTNR